MFIENGIIHDFTMPVSFGVTDDVEGEKVEVTIVVDFDGTSVEDLCKIAMAGNSKRVALVNGLMRPNGATWMKSIPTGYEVTFDRLCYKDSWPPVSPEMEAAKAEKAVKAKVAKMKPDDALALLKELQEKFA